jgi:hypothetical protein
MRAPRSVILIVLTALCSCVHRDEMRFTTGTGDAGQFILQQAVAFGGQPTGTNGVPAILGSWRYSEDSHGFVVRMSRDDYTAVEKVLNQAFGPAKFGPTEVTDGGVLGAYRLTPKGGGIYFGHNTNYTEVILIRPKVERDTTTQPRSDTTAK